MNLDSEKPTTPTKLVLAQALVDNETQSANTQNMTDEPTTDTDVIANTPTTYDSETETYTANTTPPTEQTPSTTTTPTITPTALPDEATPTQATTPTPTPTQTTMSTTPPTSTSATTSTTTSTTPSIPTVTQTPTKVVPNYDLEIELLSSDFARIVIQKFGQSCFMNEFLKCYISPLALTVCIFG